MLDQTALRTELANHYDLAPSPELAAAHPEIYAKMARVVSPPDWAMFAPYVVAINQLKKERNAVILAHNYMTPEIYHGIADVVGDSLQLAIEATKVEADVIVQCGVHFMAETSKILNPSKTVLIPDMEAGCSLAESITAEGIARDARAIPRRAGGHICEHHRRSKSRVRHLLHLVQRGANRGRDWTATR